jgi:hypothetical protein
MMPHMTTSPKQVPGSPRPSAWIIALLLLVIPAVTIGPAFVSGARLLPQLPVASAPLATERPAEAAAAIAGMNFSTADRLFPVLTDQLEAGRQLRSGSLPTWDPHLGAGVPLFGASIAALAYPPNWLALAFPPDLVAAPLAVLSLFLAGLGLLLFLRTRQLSFAAALVGAMAMQTSLYGLANLHDFMKVDAALWTPWMLYGIELMRAGRRRGGPILALSAGLSLLAGFPPIAIFGLTTAGLVALVRLGPRPAQLARALGFVLIGLMIGAWQLLPALEASSLSMRQGREATAIQAEALPVSTTAALLVPDLFGTPDKPVFGAIEPTAAWLTPASQKEKLELANALEWNLHFGSLALSLALVALITRPRAALLPAGLFVFWLGFAQGWPGLRLFYHIPGFDLGAPGRAMAMGWPLMAWLAAIGFEALASEFRALTKKRDPRFATPPRPGRAATTVALALGLGTTTLALVAWAWLDPRTAPAALIELLAHRHGISTDEVATMLRAADIEAAASHLRAALGGLVATGLFLVAAVSFTRLAAGRVLVGRASLAVALALAAALAPRLASGAFETAPHSVALVALGAALLLMVLTHGPRSGGRSPSREAFRQASWRHSAFALMLFVGLGAEALDVAPPHLTPRQIQSSLLPASPALDAVAASQAEVNGRALRLDTSPSGVADVIALARPNLLEAYGANDLTPYMVFTPRTLVELVTALEPSARFRSGIAALHDPAKLDSPVLDLLRVDTLLTRSALPAGLLDRTERLTPTFDVDGFHVTHRAGALPEALLVGSASVAPSDGEALAKLVASGFDPRAELILAPGTELPQGAKFEPGSDPTASVSLTRPSSNRIDVEVTSTTGGWLLFTEQFVPDWKVNIDGTDATMLRADHALRALWIAPGTHLVRTWYEPWSLRFGCLSMLLALAFLGAFSWRALHHPRPRLITFDEPAS